MLTTIPQESLVHGVSQQPAKSRGRFFGAAQENCLASPLLGLMKRPGFADITKLSDGAVIPQRITHGINRSFNDQFFATFGANEVRVFDLNGAEYYVADLVGEDAAGNPFKYLDTRARYRDGSGPWKFTNTITVSGAETLGGLRGSLTNSDSGIAGPLGLLTYRLLRASSPPTDGTQVILPAADTVWPDGIASASLYVQEPASLASPSFALRIYRDLGDATSIAEATFTWVSGAPTVTATSTGVSAEVSAVLEDGGYRVYMEVDTSSVAGSSPGDDINVQIVVNSLASETDLLAWGCVLSVAGPKANTAYFEDPEILEATTVTDTTFVTNSKMTVEESTFVLDYAPTVSAVLGNHYFISGVPAAAVDALYVQIVQGVYDAKYSISVGTENATPVQVTVETETSAGSTNNVDITEVEVSSTSGLWEITVDTQLCAYNAPASGLSQKSVAKGIAKAINESTARASATYKHPNKVTITGSVQGVNLNVSDPLTTVPALGSATVTQVHDPASSTLTTLDTEEIAAEFVKRFLELPTAWSDYLKCDRLGSTLVFYGREEINYFDVTDSEGGALMEPAHKDVQTFSDLPVKAVPGTRIKITQSESPEDTIGYFVEFRTDLEIADEGQSGRWVESTDYAVPLAVERTTLPHTLTPRLVDVGGNQHNGDSFPDGVSRTPGDLYFEWSSPLWEERLVGDEDLAPWPGFLDPETNPSRTIRNVSFLRNRLVFLGDTSVDFSEVNRFYSLFRTTTKTLVDSDPFYVVSSHPDMGFIDRVLPFSDRLVLFSERAQLILTGDPFALRTVSIEPFLRFTVIPEVSPVSYGERLFALHPRTKDEWVGMLEIYPDDRIFKRSDRSLQVPKYIPSDIQDFVISADGESIVVVSNSDPSTLYVYKTVMEGDQVLQTAWSKFTLTADDAIIGAHFFESLLVVLVQRPTGQYLMSLDMSGFSVDQGLDYAVCMDRLGMSEDMSPSFSAGSTTLYLPWDVPAGHTVGVVDSSGDVAEITATNTTTPGAHTVTVTGDHTTGSFVGLNFRALYEFTKTFPKRESQDGRTTTVLHLGMQLKYLNLALEDSRNISVVREAVGRADVTQEFSADSLSDVVFRASINMPTDQVTTKIISDSPLPFRVQNAEWQADYTTRGRRL